MCCFSHQIVIKQEGDKLTEQQSGKYTSNNVREIVGGNLVYVSIHWIFIIFLCLEKARESTPKLRAAEAPR